MSPDAQRASQYVGRGAYNVWRGEYKARIHAEASRGRPSRCLRSNRNRLVQHSPAPWTAQIDRGMSLDTVVIVSSMTQAPWSVTNRLSSLKTAGPRGDGGAWGCMGCHREARGLTHPARLTGRGIAERPQVYANPPARMPRISLHVRQPLSFLLATGYPPTSSTKPRIVGAAMSLVACLLLGAVLEPSVLPVPVAPLSSQDFPTIRQPQAAVAADGRIVIVFGVEDTIWSVHSTDGGRTYRPPVQVGEAGVMSLGMRRGPRIAATDKALVVTAICGQLGKGRDGDLLAWRSADGGQTWSQPVRVNSVSGSAREGLHGMASGPDGRVCCVWLDLRNRKSQVFGAISTDGGLTWKDEKLIYASPEGSVCECCQPSVCYDPKGGLHVMWRNQLQGARDMFIVSSQDGGKTFGQAVKLGDGTWKLRQCPMDGGALAANEKGEVTTIWRRDREMFTCAPGLPERSIGRGEQGWVAVGSAGAYLAWVRQRPGALMIITPDRPEPTLLAQQANDPMLAVCSTGKGPVVLVWEEGPTAKAQLRAAVLHRMSP